MHFANYQINLYLSRFHNQTFLELPECFVKPTSQLNPIILASCIIAGSSSPWLLSPNKLQSLSDRLPSRGSLKLLRNVSFTITQLCSDRLHCKFLRFFFASNFYSSRRSNAAFIFGSSFAPPSFFSSTQYLLVFRILQL